MLRYAHVISHGVFLWPSDMYEAVKTQVKLSLKRLNGTYHSCSAEAPPLKQSGRVRLTFRDWA